MLTTEERRLELVELVQKMRTAQKEFIELESKDQTLLKQANSLYFERQVDRALKMLRQRELYDA